MKGDKTIYRGKRLGPHPTTVSQAEVTVNGRMLPLTPSTRLRNHSPDGFNWGYAGSGPSQLALAILLDFTQDKKLAQQRYMDFKFAFVARWGHEWEIDGQTIRLWLEQSDHGEKTIA